MLALSLALVLVACTSRQEDESALREVERFHALLTPPGSANPPPTTDLPRVPGDAGPNAWAETAAQVKARNGPMKTTELAFHGTGVVGTDRYIGLIYRTEFENGMGFEEFSLTLGNGQATLVRYGIASSFNPQALFQ
jgi:hypothetical protein